MLNLRRENLKATAALALAVTLPALRAKETAEKPLVKARINPEGKSDAKADPKRFIKDALEDLARNNGSHNASWKLGEATRWDIDLRANELVFRMPDGGNARATEVQVIGTLENGLWTWGWDHPRVPPAQRRAALGARDWARGQGAAYERWSLRQLSNISEDEAWSFTAVAAKVDKSTGAFRGPTEGPLVYMTFGPVKVIEG